MEDKAKIRESLKTCREGLSLEERREKSYHITKHLEDFLKPYQTILAYVSKDPEVESMVIINSLLENGKAIIVPIIEKETKSLRFSYLKKMSQLEPGTFKVPEPLSCEEPANPDSIEIALLPLVGFDKFGNRLGYGAGYYDRFFAKYPKIPRIGLAYACQETEIIPVDEFDQSMNWIVTENGVLTSILQDNITKKY